MANKSNTTNLSRRAALAGGAFDNDDRIRSSTNPDTELLRRYDVTMRRLDAFCIAMGDREHLKKQVEARPDYVAMPTFWEVRDGDPEGKHQAHKAIWESSGLRAAGERVDEAHKAYGAAANSVFELEANTIPGVLAKLYLARLAVSDHEYSAFIEGEETAWLDDAIRDLELITESGRHVR